MNFDFKAFDELFLLQDKPIDCRCFSGNCLRNCAYFENGVTSQQGIKKKIIST